MQDFECCILDPGSRILDPNSAILDTCCWMQDPHPLKPACSDSGRKVPGCVFEDAISRPLHPGCRICLNSGLEDPEAWI